MNFAVIIVEHYCSFSYIGVVQCWSQWPRGLSCRSAAAHLRRSWVIIPPGEAWIFVCYKCCVLSGKGLCDELITHPEQCYRLWCIVVCGLENLKNEETMARVGSQSHSKKRSGSVLYYGEIISSG